MIGLVSLFMCFVYFLCIALDIALFFLQIRLILLWRTVDWLIPFDNAGESLVSAITVRVPQLVRTKDPLSERGKLIVALLLFAIVRIILGTLLGLT